MIARETLEVDRATRLDTAVRESAPAGAKGTDHDGLDKADRTLYLLGRPRLRDLLRFARSHAATPPDESALADAWQTAHEVVRRLEAEEADLADNPPIRKLGPEYEPLLIELLGDPLVQNGFNTVPTDVAMVELDRLVVYQKHIDLTFAGELAQKLGPAPSEEQIFRTCLLHDHTQPPVKWSRVHRDKFVFMSPSNDLRFLGVVPLQADQIKDYPPRGKFVGVVGIAVGFGSNFLNAIYAEKRLVLNNGSHRAYALRKLGVTHVPCIIQHAASRDEVEAVAASEVRKNPDPYLKHPRPPMLKDYFDPRLHLVMPVYRRLRQITVGFEVEENSVPGL
jgi:hypothetical protein